MSSKIRLNAALDWINIDDCLADIGCDHGYLSIDAIKKGVKFVQLVDNKKGPLNVAKKNLLKNNISCDNFKLTLASGLTNVDERINKVAILGMGGELIAQILEEGDNYHHHINEFILEANTKINFLRKYLFDNNYQIVEEKIVKENKKYYELILAQKVEKKVQYDELDLLFGPCLRKECNDIFKEKWQNIYQNYQNIVKNTNSDVSKIKNESKLIEEVLCIK